MTRSFCLTLLAAASVSGCASFGRQSEAPIAYEASSNPAVRCLCLWNGGEAEGGAGGPSRGFVGQLYFFNSTDPSPVAVNGDLRVFVFDDVGTKEQQTRPMHEFEITADALQGFVKSTQLGPAYEIFVPYPRPGRNAANCSLRVRLSRADGSRVFSDMAEIKLSGAESAETIATVRDLPVAEELPQHIRARGETLGVQKDGAIRPASDTQVSDFDESRVASYQQKIDRFLRERGQRELQPVAAKPNRSDRSSFEPIGRQRLNPEPAPFQPEPATTRPIPTPEPSDTFEIRTLSRPLGRQTEAPARNAELDTTATEVAPMQPVVESPRVLELPEPIPFLPVGDQASLDRAVNSLDDIKLPLPAIELPPLTVEGS